MTQLRKGPYKKLLRLSDAAILDDNQGFGFTIETVEGEKLSVACTLDELNDVFSFLGQGAKVVVADVGLQDSDKPPQELAPIPAKGIGFQAGTTPDETLLVMNLYGFWMTFSVPSSDLAQTADGFARTARTLSASGQKPS